jgi:hypothetical protein
MRTFAATKHLGIGDSARLFALLFDGSSDAILACFDSRYYYNFWRPVTAIHAAGDDGNPATDGDTGWMPLAGAPPHPEYPRGARVLRGLRFGNLMACVFGGMHYPTSGVHGATLGRNVAKWIGQHHFRPIRRGH